MTQQNNEKEQAAKDLLSQDLSAAMQQRAEQVAPVVEEVKEQPAVSVSETPVAQPSVVQEEEAHGGEDDGRMPDLFVSETFQQLKTGLSLDRDEFERDVENASIIDSIKIDLSSIEIVDGLSQFDLDSIESAVFEQKKVMQVVCCQSAYTAEMSALKNQEIQNVSDSNVDYYNYKKRLYKALWQHVEATSVGKLDFPSWMKVTSYFDVETLLYGAYCQTFPYENKYTLLCPNTKDCGKPFEAVVNNNTLIETRGKDEEVFSKINEVIANVKNSQDLIGRSLVHTTKRVALDESKIIFDIQIPSIWDYLEGILANVSEEIAEEYSTTLGLALFIKKMFIPNVVEYKRSGKLTFVPVEDKEKIIKLVAQLPYYDGIQLAEDINEFTNRYRISYSIKEVACPKCGHEIKEVGLNMEDVLFTVIRQGRREKTEPTSTQSTSTQ